MDFVKQLLVAGITVPLIVNDKAMGYWAPGSSLGAVDIYEIDSYPLRYKCESHRVSNAKHCLVRNGSWVPIQLFGPLTGSHMIGRLFTSVKALAPPSQFLSLRDALEKDGKFVTSETRSLVRSRTVHRGGVVEEKCGELVNAEAARVAHKNKYSFGVKIFNIYMVRKSTRARYSSLYFVHAFSIWPFRLTPK